MRGLNKKGEKIGRYKSDAYARKKYAQSPLAGYGYVDLRLTGAFQNSRVIDVRGNDVVFSAGDSKAPALEEKYGPTIFGLTEDSKDEVRPELVQGAAKKIKQRTGVL